jgi:hypothetical protein
MTNLLRRIVTASVLSALVLSATVPANASVKRGKSFVPARVHHAKQPVHHALGASSIPATPTNFAATAGDQQAVFSWTGASGATRYVVMLRPNNASCVTIVTTCAVRGLTNGTPYSATVVAVNGVGRSAPSAARTVTPVAARPSAPRSVGAVTFGRHARVSWLPVTGLSNPVTSYTATATPGGLTCSSTTTTCVVQDLNAGTSYTFTVTATNAIGTSPASSPSTPVTIVDRPDAPININVAPSPDSIGVSWDAPVSNGGLAIDSYIATAYLASSGAPVAHCRVVTESCEIIGLSPATTYVVRVLAHNATGYSVASATSEPVLTGYNAPGVPLDVSVSSAPNSLTVSWLTPSSDGGGAITGYTVTADDGDGGLFTCKATTLSCTISNLTDGVTYSVTVVATNGVGDSTSSTPVSGTPGSVPDAPTTIAATPGNGGVTVSWTAPIFVGGSVVTNYTVTADDGNGGLFTCRTSTTSCAVIGLTNGTAYRFTVVATNSTGNSVSSSSVTATPTRPVSVPDAPTNVTATAGSATLEVAWSWPQSDGGAAVTSFLATATDGDENSYTCLAGPGITSMWTICTIYGLTNGVTYTVTVVATNTSGDSVSSTAVTATPCTTPDAPQQVSATPGVNQVTVAWSAPVNNGGAAIVAYTAYAYDPSNNFVGFCATGGEAYSCTISGLTNFVTYHFTVVATNAAGDSTSSGPPQLPNPQAIIEWGTGWLAYDNSYGFLSSDPQTQQNFSRANAGVTQGWDCPVEFMAPGPSDRVYIQNTCGDMYYIDSSGNYVYKGWNLWGNGYQFAIGPNGELVFASDDNSLHVYDYNASAWYTKYITGSGCINGVTIDRDGTIWLADACRGDIASIPSNIFDGVNEGSYAVEWQNLPLCSPWWLSTDGTGTIYIGNNGCEQGYDVYSPEKVWNYVSTLGSNPKFVGGVAGIAMPIDFGATPHSFIASFVWATPQSLEPDAPTSGSIYSFGGTWIEGQWGTPQFGGLNHGKANSYRLTATGPQGDAHSCVTNQRGITAYDYEMYTCVVGGLVSGVTYNVSVVATNGWGDSAPEDLGTVTTFDPSVTVPTLTGSAVNGQPTTIANLSSDGSNITVSNLPPNFMVTVWVTNAVLTMTQGRQTATTLQSSYWGGGTTSVLSFVGTAAAINNDLAHMTITSNATSESVTVYAIATPNNIIYNPVNGHYYASTLGASRAMSFATNLAYAAQQSLLGRQGYMATPLTRAELNFLNGFVASNTYYGGSDDPAFILDPTTGEPLYQYLYANGDPSTASTSDYQSDPNASFQRWYWVSGPHAGQQFVNGEQLSGNATVATGVNGYESLFCPHEPNDAFMTETVTLVAGGCLNDINPTFWSSTMVEFGGMTGDEATGTAEVTSSATFTTTEPKLHVPTAVAITRTDVNGYRLSWSEPNNAASLGLSWYRVVVYLKNGDGSETQVWSAYTAPYTRVVYFGGTSVPNSYRVTVFGLNNYGDGYVSSLDFTPARPSDATNVAFTPDYWGGTVSWTLPTINVTRYWRAEAWTTDSNGESYLASANENWDPNGTSMTLYSLSSENTYSFILYAFDASSLSSTGVTFTGTSLDPYPAISQASVSVEGNAVVGTWNVAAVYGGVYATRMAVYAMDGTYVTACATYTGPGDGKSCWIGGLTLSTNYYAIIQGYGWQTGWGGGVRVDFTTDDAYVPSNYYDATGADGYIYSVAATPDGSVWYYSTTGVHHVAKGIDTIVDVSAYLPAHVGLSKMTGLANNGVAFSTNGYDNGWLDTGVLYIAPDGTVSYLGDGATNCASTIVPFGDHSVLITNFYGLTVVDLDTGNYNPLPGLGMHEQMYAQIIPANSGVIYFLDRSNNLLLHRYDGAVEGTPVFTDVELTRYVGEYAVIVDGVLYNFENPVWNDYTFTATNLTTGVISQGFNFYGVIDIPRLMGVTASGDLFGAGSYACWTLAAQHVALALG